MANQVESIISFAESYVGKSKLSDGSESKGHCQKFVRLCYGHAGIGGSAATATEAYKKWCISKKADDVEPGAAVYFNGSNPSVGHAGIYIGDGYVIHAGNKTVKKQKLSSMKGWRGWGWHGGTKPKGTYEESGADEEAETKNKPITSQKTVSVYDAAQAERRTRIFNTDINADGAQLIVRSAAHGAFELTAADKIVWTTERQDRAGTLTFTALDRDGLYLSEGNAVRFTWYGKKVFFGFIFSVSRDKEKTLKVTCCDQLRYLKNKDTYMYGGITASTLIKMIAADYRLKVGDIDDTGYIIPSRIEENAALFDIIKNALDITLMNTGKLYVLYDNFGELSLKSIARTAADICIDDSCAENFSYETSIDKETYNMIKLAYDNKETGVREIYVAQNGESMNEWGVLSMYEKVSDKGSGKEKEAPSAAEIKEKAKKYLQLYNTKSRSLKISGIIGATEIRAGVRPFVRINLGDAFLNCRMLVETARHEFSNGKHTMDLNFRGGGISV